MRFGVLVTVSRDLLISGGAEAFGLAGEKRAASGPLGYCKPPRFRAPDT